MTRTTIIPIETPTLGDRSYLVHDGEVAFVVDPQRDIDRVLDLLEQHGVRLTHVFETHIHNDYVTGGLALAQRTGAQYLVNGEDDVSFVRTPVADGQVVEVGGRMRVTALATPGHTFTHLSYSLTDAPTGTDSGEQVAVFTGGSLLYGATGRPDLLGPEHTHDLVRHQHASAHRLAELLPDDAEVFPTHGFGSFCSATQSDATSSTIGQEKTPVLAGRPRVPENQTSSRPDPAALKKKNASDGLAKSSAVYSATQVGSPPPAVVRWKIVFAYQA